MAGLMGKVKGMVVENIAKIEKPTALVTAVGIKSVTRQAVGLKSDVLLHNPYNYDMPILEITYRLRCGDREIMSGSVGNTGAVAAKSDTSIEVGSTVAFDFLINLMRDIGSDGAIDYDFDVGIKLKLPIIHSFTIPMHKKGTLKLPTLSDVL